MRRTQLRDRVLAVAGDRRRLVVAGLVVLLLGQLLAVLLLSASRESATEDEAIYVGAGPAYTRLHDLADNPQHPPLTKLLSGIATTGLHIDLSGLTSTSANETAIGQQVLYGGGDDANEILWRSRLPMIALTVLFGLVVFAFARDLFGAAGGVVSLAVYAFSPDVIANGALATNDLPMAGFLLTTAWLLWRARSARPRLHLILAGVAFGLALATKMTALVVWPVVVGLTAWLVVAHAAGRPRRARALLAVGAAAAVSAVAIAVVWVVYLAVDPGLHFSHSLAGLSPAERAVVRLVPLPAAYRYGLLKQLQYSRATYNFYFFGRLYIHTSRWYYQPVVTVLKAPLPVLALWVAGLVVLVRRRSWKQVVYVLAGAALLFVVVMFSTREFGDRYGLALPVALAVTSGAVATLQVRWWRPAVVVLAGCLAVSSYTTFPNYLSYSNIAFGGTSQTWHKVNDAADDWGQDLRRLADYTHARHVTLDWLIYKGGGSPAYYGVAAPNPISLAASTVHGLLAVDVSEIDYNRSHLRALLGGHTPIAEIGDTFLIYRLP